MKQDILVDIFGKVKSFVSAELCAKIDEIERETRREWGGAYVYVPKRDTKAIKAEVLKKINQGLSVREVSKQTGFSITGIYIMLRRKKV
jgi:hypothetical protein